MYADGLTRWERKQRTHGRGWVAPGTKRHEYIDTLKLKAGVPLAPKKSAVYGGFADPALYGPTDGGIHISNVDTGLTINANYAWPIAINWPPTALRGEPATPTVTWATSANAGTATNAIYELNLNGNRFVPGQRTYTWTSATTDACIYTDPRTAGTGAITDGTGNVLGWNHGINLWQNGYPITVNGNYVWPAVDPKAMARQRYARQLLVEDPKNHLGKPVRAVGMTRTWDTVSGPELTALELLKTMLPVDEWRRYLIYGFVLAQGKSGLMYQIVRGQHLVHVFRKGKRIADLCIFTRDVPPTDEVITKKVMVECDELGVWMSANIHNHAVAWPAKYAPTDAELQQLADGMTPAARQMATAPAPRKDNVFVFGGNNHLYLNLNADVRQA